MKVGNLILEPVQEIPWYCLACLPRNGKHAIIHVMNESVYMIETESTKCFSGYGPSTEKYIKLNNSTILVYEAKNGKTESVTVPAGMWVVRNSKE
jgi:hypothetical protein